MPGWDVYNSSWSDYELTLANNHYSQPVRNSTQIILDPTAESSETNEPLHPIDRELANQIDVWGYRIGGFRRIEQMISSYCDSVDPPKTKGKTRRRSRGRRDNWA